MHLIYKGNLVAWGSIEGSASEPTAPHMVPRVRCGVLRKLFNASEEEGTTSLT